MGENQDRTHEATHNANTIACSAGGGGGSRPQLGVCSGLSLSQPKARPDTRPTAAASTTQMSRPD